MYIDSGHFTLICSSYFGTNVDKGSQLDYFELDWDPFYDIIGNNRGIFNVCL